MARLHARRWYVANFLPRCNKFNSIQFLEIEDGIFCEVKMMAYNK